MTTVAELIGRQLPAMVVPFVNPALAARVPFRRAVAALQTAARMVAQMPDEVR